MESKWMGTELISTEYKTVWRKLNAVFENDGDWTGKQIYEGE